METNNNAVHSQEIRPIDEGMFAQIHNVPQWITLRGRNRRDPALRGTGAESASRCHPFLELYVRRRRPLVGGYLSFGRIDFDAALKVGPILDADAGAFDVAGD